MSPFGLASGVRRSASPAISRVAAIDPMRRIRHDEGHGPAFWRQLGQVMPDCDARRDRLVW
jgi:hypothetical protein